LSRSTTLAGIVVIVVLASAEVIEAQNAAGGLRPLNDRLDAVAAHQADDDPNPNSKQFFTRFTLPSYRPLQLEPMPTQLCSLKEWRWHHEERPLGATRRIQENCSKAVASALEQEGQTEMAPAPSTSHDVLLDAGKSKSQGQMPGSDLQGMQSRQNSDGLTPSRKLRLAFKNISDPFAVSTIALDAEISNAISSPQSAFGTGAAGFGRRFGMAMADDAAGEFFASFLVASVFHQDPHYHRNPTASTGKRIGYALTRALIARSDSNKPMFNYAEFLGTASASIFENSYRFDRDTGAGPTANRIFVSIGSDAVWNLMNEFLPDIAKHVNPRLIVLRRLAERAAKQHN